MTLVIPFGIAWWVMVLLPLVVVPLAVWLWRRGRRLPAAGTCAACGYDVSKRPETSTVCSECGADLTGRGAINLSARLPLRWWWRSVLAALLLLAAGLSAYSVTQPSKRQWMTQFPAWLLLSSRSWGPEWHDLALLEMAMRRYVGSTAFDDTLRDEILQAAKTDYSRPPTAYTIGPGPWSTVAVTISTLPLMLTQQQCQELFGDYGERFFGGPDSLSIIKPKKLQLGQPFEVTWVNLGRPVRRRSIPQIFHMVLRELYKTCAQRGQVGSALYSFRVLIDNRPVDTLPRGSELSVPDPMSGSSIVCPPDSWCSGISPGQHTLQVEFTYYYFPPASTLTGPTSMPTSQPVTWLSKRFPVEILAADAVVGKPVYGAEVGIQLATAAFSNVGIHTDVAGRTFVRPEISGARARIVPGVFDMIIRSDVPGFEGYTVGLTLDKGGSHISLGNASRQRTVGSADPTTQPTTVIVELHSQPSLLLANNNAESMKYWAGNIRLEGVPVQSWGGTRPTTQPVKAYIYPAVPPATQPAPDCKPIIVDLIVPSWVDPSIMGTSSPPQK
jgi:hypothetical protein